MFSPFNEEVLNLFREWVVITTESDFPIISKLMSHFPMNFIFQYSDFITDFLEKAKEFGNIHYEEAIISLSNVVFSEVRSGKLGVPFKEDIYLKEEAEKILNRVSRFSSVYFFYESIKNYAEENIKRAAYPVFEE